jgi:hypothetical protein
MMSSTIVDTGFPELDGFHEGTLRMHAPSSLASMVRLHEDRPGSLARPVSIPHGRREPHFGQQVDADGSEPRQM